MQLERTSPGFLLAAALAFSLTACGSGEEVPNDEEQQQGDVVSFKYDVLTFSVSGGAKIEVSLNGLPLETLNGANKIEGTTWEVVQRRGVRLSKILEKAGITGDDAMRVNLIGRDGYDALRSKIKDPALLPQLDFMRASAYVYSGDPGSKDPLYPEIGSNSLFFDYDVAVDADVPEYLGGTLASLNTMRMKMMEKVNLADFDEAGGIVQGRVEIDPVLVNE